MDAIRKHIGYHGFCGLLRHSPRTNTILYWFGVVRSWSQTCCDGIREYGKLGWKLFRRPTVSYHAEWYWCCVILYFRIYRCFVVHIYKVSSSYLYFTHNDVFLCFRIYLPETRGKDPSEVAHLCKDGFSSKLFESPISSSGTEETFPISEVKNEA